MVNVIILHLSQYLSTAILFFRNSAHNSSSICRNCRVGSLPLEPLVIKPLACSDIMCSSYWEKIDSAKWIALQLMTGRPNHIVNNTKIVAVLELEF